ncbi:MAG: biotin--[acetyl-CoA-carboxylase] ligase [Pseudomonadota bacterium]
MSDYRIERRETVASTMDAARERAAEGAAEGIWIIADRQTEGRGRQGRVWRSGASGNLTASLLLRPKRTPAETATLSFIAALAVVDALRALGLGASIALKWPNDVLVEGEKIAGLLLEAGGGEAGAWLVLGVGVNLASAPDVDELTDAAARPTALSRHGVDAAPEAALAALAPAFAARYGRWRAEGFAGQRDEWLAQAAGLGAPLIAKSGAEEISGVFEDVDEDGALVLKTGTTRRRVHAADVYFPGAV